jgi:riboflavin synthase
MGFDLSEETLGRTTLGGLRPGQKVNLEEALRLGDALGGHFVQGHVEGTGRILSKKPQGAWTLYEFTFFPGLRRYLVPKGSVAVDGISLTVVKAKARTFTAAVIPHTEKNTSLKFKKPGDSVNMEPDMIPRYLEKLLSHQRTNP